MSEGTRLGPGREFDKIREMIALIGHSASQIGDDAAVIGLPGGDTLVVSTDTCVESVHFKREWMNFEEIGFRATAAALSDLAAMGASPLGVVVAYGVPTADIDSLGDLARGAGAAAAASSTVVVGGDLSSSDTVTVTVTVFGVSNRPLLRSAARTGDIVYVTGTFGAAKLALDALQSGSEPSPDARRRFVSPSPRIREALWLADRGANACIDISDGLSGDLGHIAAASGVELDIEVQYIPLFPGCRTEQALVSGEEYELCVTMPEQVDTDEFERLFGIPLTRIGTVLKSSKGRVDFGPGVDLGSASSFNHFRE